MLKIGLQFPAGRFHATPWGRHVNEGAVEWPPSPWRLLRALIATWHLKSGLQDDVLLRALVTKLAGTLPTYQLPRAAAGHTRHYMPMNEGKSEKRTKVFDTFLHPAGALKIAWEVDLGEKERALLTSLLKNLSYFGRAESLVEAAILANSEKFEANAQPLEADATPAKDEELVRLLAPLSAEAYEKWRSERTASTSQEQTARRARGKVVRAAAGAALPTCVFDALLADTGELQRAGWNLAPGAQLVSYTRPLGIFDVEPIRRTSRTRKAPPTVARYAIANAVLPRITQAISVAERVHQSLVKFSNNAPVFTGRYADGTLMTGHRHAHVFCESVHRQAIKHVTVHAPMGFDVAARDALKLLRSVWGHGGHDLQLVLLGVGDRWDFVDAEDGCPLLDERDMEVAYAVCSDAAPEKSSRRPAQA